MHKLLYLFLLCIPSFIQAQLYEDESNRLPNSVSFSPSMDVQVADLDGDGNLDIVLANEFQANSILFNDGDANFTKVTSALPQKNKDSEDVAIGDFNNDGHLDLVFCSEDDVTLGGSNVHEYYLGNGNGQFEESNIPLPDSEANAVLAYDVNGDGHLDLLFGNNGANTLLLNDGSGLFTQSLDRLPQINRTTQDLALFDIDGDGDLDIFEGNENGNLLLVNDGNGFFNEESLSRLPQGLNIETRKVTSGDIDGDGDLDVFLSNVEFIPGKNRQNRLLVNDGMGHFEDVTANQLPSDFDLSLEAIFKDVDLDNDLDLVIGNFFGSPVKVYLNDGNGSFSESTLDVLGAFYVRDALGIIAADFNGDNLEDIYICNRNSTNNPNNKDVLLLKNNATTNVEANAEFIQELNIFPNPSDSVFNIQLQNPLPERMEVFDPSGRSVVEKLEIGTSELAIDLSDHADGHYVLTLFYEGGLKVSHVLVKT